MNLSREQVGRRIAGIVGDRVRVVLPRRLPPGFKLAVPYIAVGDGTARPNPEGWGKSYRVSYTDGWGLVMMTYGAARLPDGVIWHENGLRIDGRPARAGVAGEAVVVATDDGRPLVVVIGRNAPPEQVLACAESLAPWR